LDRLYGGRRLGDLPLPFYLESGSGEEGQNAAAASVARSD
jgi:hypothetical protein